jgi:outer membrane lipoprotein-sorting protein
VIKGEPDEVTVQKSSNLPLIKFLDSVKDGIENSKLFSAKYEKNDLTLTFVPTIRKEMGFEEVTLHATTDSKLISSISGFERITLKNVNKSKTSIKLIDLKENVSFSIDHFQFKPTPGTKIKDL